jgi:hypothetical protein
LMNSIYPRIEKLKGSFTNTDGCVGWFNQLWIETLFLLIGLTQG